MRRVTAALFAGAVLTVAFSAAMIPSWTHGVTTPHCRLAIRYVGSNVGTGNVFAYFRINNGGTGRCNAARYPVVRLIGPATRPIVTRQIDRDPFGFVQHPVHQLDAGQSGHFYVIFRPLTPSGAHRCTPTARAATVKWGHQPGVHVSLPSRVRKQRLPINPCRGEITVTRVDRGK